MIPKQDENKALTDADGKRMARSVTGSIARASEGVASGSTATLDADTHRDELNKTLNVNPGIRVSMMQAWTFCTHAPNKYVMWMSCGFLFLARVVAMLLSVCPSLCFRFHARVRRCVYVVLRWLDERERDEAHGQEPSIARMKCTHARMPAVEGMTHLPGFPWYCKLTCRALLCFTDTETAQIARAEQGVAAVWKQYCCTTWLLAKLGRRRRNINAERGKRF
jgi:hypothetical protein